MYSNEQISFQTSQPGEMYQEYHSVPKYHETTSHVVMPSVVETHYMSPPPIPTPTQTIIINESREREPRERVSLIASCPMCRRGNLKKSCGCCGVCLGIFCFPCGLLCCLLCKDTVCEVCDYRNKRLCC